MVQPKQYSRQIYKENKIYPTNNNHTTIMYSNLKYLGLIESIKQ